MVALALFGIAAVSLTNFDLATLPKGISRALVSAAVFDRSEVRSQFLPPKIERDIRDAGNNVVRIKLRWKRVKLYVPFGPG